MTLSGDGRRLQTCGGLAAQLFDSTLRTYIICMKMNWFQVIINAINNVPPLHAMDIMVYCYEHVG
jgi:hypothetical protein